MEIDSNRVLIFWIKYSPVKALLIVVHIAYFGRIESARFQTAGSNCTGQRHVEMGFSWTLGSLCAFQDPDQAISVNLGLNLDHGLSKSFAGLVQEPVWKLQWCEHYKHVFILQRWTGLLCHHTQTQTWSHVSIFLTLHLSFVCIFS